MRFVPDAAGPVSVSVTVTKSGGCTATHTASTTADALPPLTVTMPANVCDRHGVTASVDDAGPGATYSWNVVYGVLAAGSDPTSRSITFDVDTDSAVAELTVHLGSCTKLIRKEVRVDQKPVASVFGESNTCAPNTVMLRATGGSNYVWSNG
ncbi:MAG TPA: hypothetical protein VF787_20370, partial [Thermoanaerobaculia bacterium]